MLKLFRYLKKSFLSIMLIIALLIVQAICDLTLPDYTSRIVNVGIQQGGITETSPKIIRSTLMDSILLFVSSDDKKYVLEQYTLLNDTNLSKEEYQNKTEKYPILKQETLYEKKSDSDRLDEILAKPILMVSVLAQDTEETKMMKEQLFSSLQSAGLDTSNMTVLEALTYLPQEARDQMLKEMETKLKDFPDMMVSQAAVAFNKTEYKTVGMNTDKIQTNYILLSGLQMLGLALISMVATILVGLIGARLAARLAQVLRSKVFRKVMDFSKTEMKDFSTASLITRTTNDIQQVQMVLVMMLRTVFYAPLIGIGGVIKSLNTNTSMGWIIAVAIMAILSLVIMLFAVAMPKFKVIQKLVDKLNLVSREILSGLPVIRAFSTEKQEEKRFDDANQELTKVQIFVNRIMAFMMPAMNFIMNGVVILIIWIAAKQIDTGAMQVGDMMAFIQYTMQIIMAFLMISIVSIMWPRASISAKRISEVLEKEPSIKDPTNPTSIPTTGHGVVEFKDVNFRYADADVDVIEHVSFKAEPGKTTAFIGSTGSGKSTLISLIPRFYDITSGEILIDGVNIKDITLKDLHSKIGFVPQKGILFNGTVRSNIKYGNENMSDEDMIEAARIAQASEFIERLDGGYDAPISQGGTNVSGGQKQRLSIARAIAIHPDIYIFDDSFSALDFKTDAVLRAELKKVTADSTVLIVAQRISTVMNADQIIVLNEGKIAGMGTHEELMKTSDIYREIALSQLSKEELEDE